MKYPLSRGALIALQSLLVAIFCESTQAADIQDWLGRASDIAVVMVKEGRLISGRGAVSCGIKYELEIEQLIRGRQVEIKTIVTDASLVVGGRYLLVMATSAPWASREFATDVPVVADRFDRSTCESEDAATRVRSAELRPIERNLLTHQDWVAFPPQVFGPSPEVRRVSDMDRIDLVAHRIEWPTVSFVDYFSLADVIATTR